MIEMTSIEKSYQRPGEGRLDVLRDLALSVEAGEFVAVVGPSGSGKSTLMNLLGLLDRPDGGRYRLGGETVSELTPDQLARLRNRKIGFVFQQFHLLPKTTALENVELPLVYSDLDDPRQRALDALERVGLADRRSHYPDQLSGGQQQRVAIARALVNDPDLILADEPTGNLDRESGDGVMDLFAELNGRGRTLVLITHDAELARRTGRVLRMDGGRLADGRREQGREEGGAA
jgi:ABC-type lipoprotein export system ATPase subunit